MVHDGHWKIIDDLKVSVLRNFKLFKERFGDCIVVYSMILAIMLLLLGLLMDFVDVRKILAHAKLSVSEIVGAFITAVIFCVALFNVVNRYIVDYYESQSDDLVMRVKSACLENSYVRQYYAVKKEIRKKSGSTDSVEINAKIVRAYAQYEKSYSSLVSIIFAGLGIIIPVIKQTNFIGTNADSNLFLGISMTLFLFNSILILTTKIPQSHFIMAVANDVLEEMKKPMEYIG